MHVKVVAVGRVKDRALRSLIEDYTSRIARYARYSEVELRDAPSAELVPRIQREYSARDRVVALEVDGKRMSSHGLADWFQSSANTGVQSLVFLIGGSHGLPSEVSKQAHLKLSLSDMIFPHRLARLFLVEQIYRAYTINRGEPYSH
jgi:23S rRNA (pseudouridine1915-N3)-methyltransferase